MRKFCIAFSLAIAAVLSGCGGGDNDTPPSSASPPTQTSTFEVAAFVAPQSDLLEETGFAGLTPSFPQFKEQTIRQVAHLSTGGSALKIKFSNLFGVEPLTLDKVHIARNLGNGNIDASTDKALTFSGSQSVTIAPGSEVYSDVIAYPTAAFTDISVSIYMKSATVRTARRFSTTTTYLGTGDLTSSAAMPSATKLSSIYYMSQVSVVRDSKVNVIVAMGDSITEGGGSTTDAYNSWPDQLARIANSRFEVAVVNAGLGGNRWVKDGLGQCGLCRLDRDVLSVPGVTHVILSLGVNDIGLGYYYSNTFKDPSQLVTAKQITDNIQAAVDKAKAKGIKVFLGTITPFKGTYYYTSGQPGEVPFGATVPYNGEQVRQDVNAFIRANKTIDGFIDFDKVMQDPSDPQKALTAWTFDGTLHPNDVGYAHMAQAVDVETLR
ncbi:G-D-S-L family lipolytic protein [Cupriavidus phytorum]|uniref:G-D-S-L family lipolytic protein n=2 Tax=Cupriavidus TaxID=106589 RepID=A0A975XIC6_9BURK|nr:MULTISPECIES: GDSL-type esterase/lipase family protein [Cupriavidus]MCO4887894.1 GDSL-type esterase/lipase family protein [Cupriavidus sp. WGtm5]PZX34268.1 lysophospholipase L1-like esterase [Cupriavidus alkaliphilus]SOY71816.1 G-D-S-L family lipolytic protein [Cupriavidus taiwanensis]